MTKDKPWWVCRCKSIYARERPGYCHKCSVRMEIDRPGEDRCMVFGERCEEAQRSGWHTEVQPDLGAHHRIYVCTGCSSRCSQVIAAATTHSDFTGFGSTCPIEERDVNYDPVKGDWDRNRKQQVVPVRRQ